MIQPKWQASIHHDGSSTYVSNSYPCYGESIQLKIRIGKHTPLIAVYLRMEPNGEQALYKMELFEETPYHWIYATEQNITEPFFHYHFLLETQEGLYWYNALGITQTSPFDAQDFKILVDQSPISWLSNAVFYQIFPDSFYNGDSSNDVKSGETNYYGIPSQTLPWGELPPDTHQKYYSYYGGDLQGIQQKLEHLLDLGINALYLNPIFTAPSSHKYNVENYEEIDPHFGGQPAFESLHASLKENDIRMILDIVPNHCGQTHPWFQKAQADPNAPENEYFIFQSHPDQYSHWLFATGLPKLNYHSQKLREKMYQAKDSIMRYWLKWADGWRVDVGNMLAREDQTQLRAEVLNQMRIAIKEESTKNNEKFFLGENFFDATEQLQGDQFDSTMNYKGFMFPLLHWLAPYTITDVTNKTHLHANALISTDSMVIAMQTFQANLPWSVFIQQFNLLGSHDTTRIKTVVGEDPALEQIAIACQFTYPGVPCVYYGDEIGLTNLPRIRERAAMQWDSALQDLDLLNFYKTLIDIRKSSPALTEGSMQTLYLGQDQWIYSRSHAKEKIIISLSRSDNSQTQPIEIPLSNTDLIGDEDFSEVFSQTTLSFKDQTLIIPPHSKGAKIYRWIAK
jgi:alpha-glucosidase